MNETNYEIKRHLWMMRDGEPTPPADPPPPPADPPRPDPPPPDPPPALTAAEMNSQIEQRVQAARDEIRRSVQGEMERRYGAKLDDLSELERLRKDEAERVRKEAEAKGEYRRIVESMTEAQDKQQNKWNQEREQLIGELRRTRVDGELRAASSGAVKPEQIARLLSDRVRLDDETFDVKVLDDNGVPMLNEGRAMTVSELVERYLADNPHLAKTTQVLDKSSGAGGSSGPGGAVTVSNPEIVKLEEQFNAANERAQRSCSATDIADAYRLKRALVAKRRDVADGVK